jgi:DNA polymerase-3 subunit gamma/tau
MAYTVLARRYRSGTFDEVIGQEHIAQTLKKAITSGRIAHAYLFCGTRGTGKTSTARILAKCLNCLKHDGPAPEPCNQCESCLGVSRGDDIDVIEIDAASNTGVDNVRDIIENSRYRPSRSRFKVYIIDEVHMLSKSAFNALLKTLEEPPSHVKFILATTEPEKVLPTILSRCQRYDFRNIPTREIAGHLKEICVKEKIKADEDALLLVAKAGAGSMRDSLSLLDRLLSIGESELTTDLIEQLLGMPKAQLVFNLAQAIGEGDVKTVLQSANTMIQNGLSPDTLIASVVEHLRNLLILRACGQDSELVEVPGMSMKDLLAQAGRFEMAVLSQDIALLEELRRNLRTSQAGRALLEAALVRLALAEQFTSVDGLLEQIDGQAKGEGALKKNDESRMNSVRPSPRPEPTYPSPATPKPTETATAKGQESASATAVADDADDDLPRPGKVWTGPSLAELARQPMKTAAPVEITASNVETVDPSNLPAIWQALLTLLATKGPALASLLHDGRFVGVQDGRAVIRYPHGHETMLKMLDRNGKKEQIRDAFTQVLGESVGIAFECEAEGPAAAAAAPAVAPPPRVPVVAAVQKQQAAPTLTDPQIRITTELCASLRDAEPLIRAVMEELGGEIVRVE